MTDETGPDASRDLVQWRGRRRVLPGFLAAAAVAVREQLAAPTGAAKKTKKAKKKCKAPKKTCNGKCINLKTSEQHCGACNTQCWEGGTCVNGTCVAKGGPEVSVWGGPGNGPLGFDQPGALALSPTSNDIYLADTNHHRIVVVNSLGEFVKQWGTGIAGMGDTQLNRPGGLAFHPTDNRVYIADTANHRLKVVSKNGDFLMHWGSQGNGWGNFTFPQGVAVSPDGVRLYVTDSHNHRVTVLNAATGQTLATWGAGEGDGKQQLSYPIGIAVNPAGTRIYVADTGNSRIKIYAPDGAVLTIWEQKSGKFAPFTFPLGVSVSSDGSQVIVADTDHQRVRIFSPAGKVLRTVQHLDGGQVSLKNPSGAVLGPQKTLYVADRGHNALLKVGL